MVIGIDTSHPQPGAGNGHPSVAAIVFTLDSQYSRYEALTSVQLPRTEVVADLYGMLLVCPCLLKCLLIVIGSSQEALRRFYVYKVQHPDGTTKPRGILPSRLIIYRYV